MTSNARAKAADRLRRAIQTTFDGEKSAEVLVHLAEFCGAMKSNYRENPHEMAYMEGRRSVWLEIQKNLNLTEEDLFNLARNLGEDYE